MDRGVLTIRSERHRAIPAHPRHELLVRPHKTVASDAEDDTAELVDHLIGSVGLARDLRVQAKQGSTDRGLKHCVAGGTCETWAMDIRPAQARHPAEQELLDSVGFIEHWPDLQKADQTGRPRAFS